MGKLILILGGARSGKSTFAEKLAQNLGGYEVMYLATAACLDEEMEQRVALHRSTRPSEWKTIEETLKVAEVIETYEGSEQVILLDCLTLLTTNLLLDESFGLEQGKEKAILAEFKRMIKAAKDFPGTVIMVSNEVGLGLVPSYELGREWRDIVGRVNQLVAESADEVHFTIAGIPVELKALQKKLAQ